MIRRDICLALSCWLSVAALYSGHVWASTPDPDPALFKLLPSNREREEVIARIQEHYVDPVDVGKLTQGDLRVLVREVDPEGEYLDASAMRELIVRDPDAAGLGLELAKVGGYIKIVEPLEDSPGARAGLLSGDLIVRIDDEPIAELTLHEAVKRLRGKPGSEVKLSVLREERPVDQTLKREIIRLQSVQLHALGQGYVQIRVSRFADDTPTLLANLLKARYSLDEPRGMVLDLRNNTGGLLPVAVAVAAVFLPENSLVASVTGRHPDNNFDLLTSTRFYARGVDPLLGMPKNLKRLPMVVLVNENTAAGAEMVAGALQDHKRAQIVGSRTLGRASIQTILPLSSGAALKLTTGRWHTPRRKTVHRQGLIPDVPSKAVEKRGSGPYPTQDAQLDEALLLLKTSEPQND